MNFFDKLFRRRDKHPGKLLRKLAVIEEFTAPSEIKRKDILEIAVSGHFSNLSWKLAEATVQVNENEILISVIGEKPSGIMSAQALKPYQTVIKVKKLKTGKYKIRAAKGTQKEIEVVVK